MWWVWLILAVALALLLARLPWWVSGVVLGLGLGLVAFVMAVGGMERAISPALLYALALSLLVPVGLAQRKRVAPARRQLGRARTAAAHNHTLPDVHEIPGYEVLEKVGSGGMASVYKARRRSDGRVVALKIPREQYVADAKFIRRFHREAEVAQHLDHVNIVHTYEHGSIGTKHYMVMEFVDGRSLESFIEAKIELGLSIEIMKLVVGALSHIHSAGIIHRDIKPANIMILRGAVRPGEPLPRDAVKLMDFGIAGGKVLTRLTMTGARVGTPVYMSPEQARGLKIDHRSDIYSLGLVFYEMLTGQTAFKGGYEAIVHQQIFQTPPPPRQLNLAIPKAIDALVMRMIAKDPDERPRLDEVLEVLSHEEHDAGESELPSRIVLTVDSRQGIRILDLEGRLHSSLGDIGMGDGHFPAPPTSLAVDLSGNLYTTVVEYRADAADRHMIYKLDPKGKVCTTFGGYGVKPGEFLYPASIAVAPDGRIFVLDSESHLVQIFDATGEYRAGFGGRGQGRGLFNDPRSLTIGQDGAVYVLDYGNRQVQRFDALGRYQTRWALKLGPDQEGVRLLDGFAVDDSGNLYISDATSGKIRKITAKGKVSLSYTLEPLPGETTESLLDIGIDDLGMLYAARRSGHLIRKYDPSGRLVATLETYAPVVQMVIDIRRPGRRQAEDSPWLD
jgi:serine/threonine-protein kinase